MSDTIPQPRGLSRRGLFASGAGALALTALVPAQAARATVPASGVQVAGVYRRKLGTIEVTSLLDGYIDVGNQLWTGIAPEMVDSAIVEAFLDNPAAIRIGITSYLLNTGDRLILVDSGSADLFGPSAGRFLENLATAGVDPAQVDDILVTHMHPDHIGAMVNGTVATFPKAAVHVSATDLDYWTSDDNRAAAPDFARPWFDRALAVKAAYGERVSTFSGNATVLPGITAEPLPGHTPGHTGFRVNSDGKELLIWGDACGVAAVQFRHPEAGLVFDVDEETGRATRKRLLDMAATDRVLAAAAHLPFPSFGHVARTGDAYAWEPEEWQFI